MGKEDGSPIVTPIAKILEIAKGLSSPLPSAYAKSLVATDWLWLVVAAKPSRKGLQFSDFNALAKLNAFSWAKRTILSKSVGSSILS